MDSLKDSYDVRGSVHKHDDGHSYCTCSICGEHVMYPACHHWRKEHPEFTKKSIDAHNTPTKESNPSPNYCPRCGSKCLYKKAHYCSVCGADLESRS